jgi:Arc/MetJ-type ribon-helix-helix transcriptional regulator
MANKITITISNELKGKLEKRIKQTDFKSISDYMVYILNEIVSFEKTNTDFERQAYTKEEEEDIAGDPDLLKSLQPHTEEERADTSIYSEEDEEALKKNLEDLGYL